MRPCRPSEMGPAAVADASMIEDTSKCTWSSAPHAATNDALTQRITPWLAPAATSPANQAVFIDGALMRIVTIRDYAGLAYTQKQRIVSPSTTENGNEHQ